MGGVRGSFTQECELNGVACGGFLYTCFSGISYVTIWRGQQGGGTFLSRAVTSIRVRSSVLFELCTCWNTFQRGPDVTRLPSCATKQAVCSGIEALVA